MTRFENKLNEAQRDTLKRLRRTLSWSDYSSIVVRKDGQDHWFEADWIRDAIEALCGPETA